MKKKRSLNLTVKTSSSPQSKGSQSDERSPCLPEKPPNTSVAKVPDKSPFNY